MAAMAPFWKSSGTAAVTCEKTVKQNEVAPEGKAVLELLKACPVRDVPKGTRWAVYRSPALDGVSAEQVFDSLWSEIGAAGRHLSVAHRKNSMFALVEKSSQSVIPAKSFAAEAMYLIEKPKGGGAARNAVEAFLRAWFQGAEEVVSNFAIDDKLGAALEGRVQSPTRCWPRGVKKEDAQEDSLPDAAPGDQDLHSNDPLDAEMPDVQGGCDDADRDSAESMDLEPDAEQSPSLGAEVQTITASQTMESAVDQLQDEVQRLRRELAEACAGVDKLKDESGRQSLENARLVSRKKVKEAQLEKCRRNAKTDPEIQEIYATITALEQENDQLKHGKEILSAKNQQLLATNELLNTQLTERSRDVMADPDVKDLCDQLTGLQLQNDQLQQCVARHVEQNEATAACRSQSVEARPAKSLRGFDVGDTVYVAPEYWHLMGKHPRGYDHTTRFVIVKQAYRQGFWDLCAKKDMRTKPATGACAWLTMKTCQHFKKQEQTRSVYTVGLLSDVPARLLNARPSPPARNSEYTSWIDFTRK